MSQSYESIWSHLTGVAFKQDWIDAGGVSTRFVQAGDPHNPTVIFIHGIGGSWEAFCANIGPFSEHFQVIAFDNVGAGFSEKPDKPLYAMSDYVAQLHGIYDALGIAKASLIGVSMGAWCAINFTHAYPDKVDRLVVAAASGMKRPADFQSTAITSIRDERAKAIENPSWDNIAYIFRDLIHNPDKRIPDLIKLRQAIYMQPEMKASMQRILAITATEHFNESALSDDQWRTIKHHVLLLDSADDSEHFRRNTQRAHKLLSNSEIWPITGVAHWPQFEAAEQFNPKVISFLKSAA
ncbi:alpha/beta fold hydrolase [Propylenella binzhouense]|uniref:Alpha/beta hydrolase n=1 Tax=Propylenella binzhouense TaxID=2555902 RepID=A0A964T295_9HYPH|nr:alpha/beta hydrolase [Propylenella binzhouense]MYZ47156.1 alpha/beta hydrolase [Propylenella binzhouense]